MIQKKKTFERLKDYKYILSCATGNVYRFEGSWPHLPKGCLKRMNPGFYLPGSPFEASQGWNTHETGASKEHCYSICKTYYHPAGNYKGN